MIFSGQTVKVSGIALQDSEMFSHGQLYVALSRCGENKNITILCDPTKKMMNDAINFASLLSREELNKIIEALEELLLLKEFFMGDTEATPSIVNMMLEIINENFLIEYYSLMTRSEMMSHLQTFKDAKKIQLLEARINAGN